MRFFGLKRRRAAHQTCAKTKQGLTGAGRRCRPPMSVAASPPRTERCRVRRPRTRAENGTDGARRNDMPGDRKRRAESTSGVGPWQWRVSKRARIARSATTSMGSCPHTTAPAAQPDGDAFGLCSSDLRRAREACMFTRVFACSARRSYSHLFRIRNAD